MELVLSRNKKRGGYWLTDVKSRACIGFMVRSANVDIVLVYVPEKMRGKGLGSEILKKGVAYLSGTFPDRPLTLLCMHLPGAPIPMEELAKWYGRHGFRMFPGQKEGASEMNMVHDPDGMLVRSILESDAPEIRAILEPEAPCRP